MGCTQNIERNQLENIRSCLSDIYQSVCTCVDVHVIPCIAVYSSRFSVFHGGHPIMEDIQSERPLVLLL